MSVIPGKKNNKRKKKAFKEINVNIQIITVISMRNKFKAHVLFKQVKSHKYFKSV